MLKVKVEVKIEAERQRSPELQVPRAKRFGIEIRLGGISLRFWLYDTFTGIKTDKKT